MTPDEPEIIYANDVHTLIEEYTKLSNDDHKFGGRCPKCKASECDEMDVDYGLTKDNKEVLCKAMICNICGRQFTDEYLYNGTRIED